ncbi:glucosaminidase domain-containing protein [Aliirhizobium terrae]|uniref:glucosaminidase domain-containing protein n=1 Tax=Terrirhizobium terrae TaxID=2926709 RepID=UPI002574A4C0|nr:glucosaminidase domain-containing protein [Rhizobium sp. CC-CFT758]WJH39396.1 glucosaminidase domain-containing protein [Rhizobium sp. CC-CFT758]
MSIFLPTSANSEQVDRQGIGPWCYNPVRSPTSAEKVSFVEEVSAPAVDAERKWGVPAPILAAMAIVESGYGFTRIAIKSNNILAFKWPGDTIAAGRKKFKLWCQPLEDKGNIYPAFKTRAEAIDFVASRLKFASHYKAATVTYGVDLKNGVDRKTAARKWLRTIAPKYNWRPEQYIPDVSNMVEDPIGDGSRTLWRLGP